MYLIGYCVFQYPNFLYDIAPSGLGTSGGAAVLERGVLKDGGCWHEERVPPEGPDLAQPHSLIPAWSVHSTSGLPQTPPASQRRE